MNNLESDPHNPLKAQTNKGLEAQHPKMATAAPQASGEGDALSNDSIHEPKQQEAKGDKNGNRGRGFLPLVWMQSPLPVTSRAQELALACSLVISRPSESLLAG